MENFGAFIVVAISCLIRVSIIGSDFVLYHTAKSKLELYFSVSQVVAYLLYPLLGWLSDTYFTRYKVIRLAFIILSATMAIFLVSDIVYISYNVFDFLTGVIAIVPGILFTLVSLGMFEANIIQFGMDQLLEATSSQLSAFIHWYFWSTHIGQMLMHLLGLGFLLYYKNCTMKFESYASVSDDDILFQIAANFLMCMVAVQSILGIVGLCILIRNKKNLNVEKTGHNPLSLIYNVLRYAWKHTCPENRSAFTYWEEDIPSRIDLGKSKYGGPFTTEEVEDTKSFFRILLLLFSLMGFHLTGHGFSTARQLFRKECPSFWLLMILVAPMFLTSIIILAGVPFYHFINKYCCRRYIPNMLLKKMGIGLLCCLLKELIELGLQFTQEIYSTQECLKLQHSYYPFADCYYLVSEFDVNGTCINIKDLNNEFAHCTANNSVYLLLLVVPYVLQGITYLLVFMTALEFICAQAPLRLKGLLIGVWYASLATHYLVVEIPDIFIIDTNTWEVFHEVKACLIAFSLIFYLWVSKRYHYRIRDEVVNEQFLVEEVYERELMQAEKYEREKQAEMRAIYGDPINRPICRYGTTTTDQDSTDVNT